MKNLTYLGFVCLLCATQTACAHTTISKVYLDGQGNVHEVAANGTDSQITTSGNVIKVKLAKNSKTIAWLVPIRNSVTGIPTGGSDTLAIKFHKRVQKIHCAPFIRDFWFVSAGKEVAINCGGKHFAGKEILYSIATLRKIDSFNEASTSQEKRPTWASSKHR